MSLFLCSFLEPNVVVIIALFQLKMRRKIVRISDVKEKATSNPCGERASGHQLSTISPDQKEPTSSVVQ